MVSSSRAHNFFVSTRPDARFARTACAPCPMTHVCMSVRPPYIQRLAQLNGVRILQIVRVRGRRGTAISRLENQRFGRKCGFWGRKSTQQKIGWKREFHIGVRAGGSQRSGLMQFFASERSVLAFLRFSYFSGWRDFRTKNQE